MKNVRDLLYIAMMTTILVILGFIPAIPLGFIPVPIVLQNLGIMLAGVLLGWKKGACRFFCFSFWGCLFRLFLVVPCLLFLLDQRLVMWLLGFLCQF